MGGPRRRVLLLVRVVAGETTNRLLVHRGLAIRVVSWCNTKERRLTSSTTSDMQFGQRGRSFPPFRIGWGNAVEHWKGVSGCQGAMGDVLDGTTICCPVLCETCCGGVKESEEGE